MPIKAVRHKKKVKIPNRLILNSATTIDEIKLKSKQNIRRLNRFLNSDKMVLVSSSDLILKRKDLFLFFLSLKENISFVSRIKMLENIPLNKRKKIIKEYKSDILFLCTKISIFMDAPSKKLLKKLLEEIEIPIYFV